MIAGQIQRASLKLADTDADNEKEGIQRRTKPEIIFVLPPHHCQAVSLLLRWSNSEQKDNA